LLAAMTSKGKLFAPMEYTKPNSGEAHNNLIIQLGGTFRDCFRLVAAIHSWLADAVTPHLI
jgi:hypothetical protein